MTIENNLTSVIHQFSQEDTVVEPRKCMTFNNYDKDLL